ncbi:MAG: zinc-ribbon domain-containing protein [Lentimicrobium sp.]
MNFCIKCGNQLKSEARFCSKCGQVVKVELQPSPVAPAQKPSCSKCGTRIEPGVKFCTSCGAPVHTTSAHPSPVVKPVAADAPPAQAPPLVNPAPQPRIQAPPSAIPPKMKTGRKILVIAVSAIVLLAVAGAAIYFFGTFDPKESYADLSALYEEEKVDQAKIDNAASEVENIFLTADTVKLARILSPTTLGQNREFFSELQPHMAAFGQDFKTRKFLYGTARFAVYEFSSAHGTYTAEFCLGDDGKWKLMRF